VTGKIKRDCVSALGKIQDDTWRPWLVLKKKYSRGSGGGKKCATVAALKMRLEVEAPGCVKAAADKPNQNRCRMRSVK
jgi:hypothetical protein